MRNTWIIFRREMRSYFVSPVAYAILVAFLGVSGWAFFHTLSSFVIYAARATEQALVPRPVVFGALRVMDGDKASAGTNVLAQQYFRLVEIRRCRRRNRQRRIDCAPMIP